LHPRRRLTRLSGRGRLEWTVNASDALNKVAEKLYDTRGRKIADLISGGVLPSRYISEFDYVINADRGPGLAVQTEDNANGSTLSRWHVNVKLNSAAVAREAGDALRCGGGSPADHRISLKNLCNR